jgi:PadR family transcriptional regulator, regulatory protein PadR
MDGSSSPRMTLPTQLVLRALLEEPTREMYGLEICAAAGLPSGTIHPILGRLEQLGWLESRWEEIDPHTEKRPRRRYYKLSKDGAALARESLSRATSRASRIGALRPNVGGGRA